MRANFRLFQTFAWSLGILVSLAPFVPEAHAAILNVSTAAQLETAVANAQPGDTIVLAPGEYRPSDRLSIAVALTILGDPSAPSIVDGGGNDIFQVLADGVRFENLTIRNGAIAIGFAASGTLEIRGTTITGNTRLGVATGDGGGHVIVVNSTIAGNVNPELTGPAAGIGSACSSFTLRNVTVSGNDRGLFIGSCSDDTVTIENTLIVDNGIGGISEDCRSRSGYTLTGRASFDSDGTCRTAEAGGSGVFTTVPGHLVGLGPLAANGGPTMTMALPALSRAVDAGGSCTEPLDQRGALRDAACDIGAFERSAAVRMTSASGAGAVDFQTSAGTFLTFHPIAEADMPSQSGKPAAVTFPFGFFEWSVGTPGAGQATDITMTFPTAVPTPAQYWKVVNGVWTDVCLQLPCVVNGNRLTITFRDGAIGDLDGVANAVIVDPGGPGRGGASVCDYVSVGLSPSTVVAGTTVRIDASLRSCATTRQSIALRFTFAGPVRQNGCAAVTTTIFTTPTIRLWPGFNLNLSFPFRVPRTTCAGVYSVSIATLVNGTVADTATATLTVVR
jgi:hypothetical protein